MDTILPLQLETVGQLRKYLAETKQSPEQFALNLQVSNMTVRRLLARGDSHPIPAKYRTQFQRLASANLGTFANLLDDIEKSGGEVSDVSKLRAQVKNKLREAKFERTFTDKIRSVAKQAFSKTGPRRALCVGALLYLINPFDLIPDALGVAGYLDDYAVMALVCDALSRVKAFSRQKKGEPSKARADESV